MNNNKSLWIAVVVVAIIAVIGMYLPSAISRPSNESVTAVGTTSNTNLAGTYGITGTKIGTNCGDAYTFPTCAGTVTNGGVLSTTTGASMTLAPSDLGFGTILMTPTVGAISVTLPASTTSGMSSFLPNTGDSTRFIIFNATSTIAANILLVTGTGTLLETASSSGTTASTAAITPARSATLECFRKANTDIVCLMLPFI